MSSIKAIYRHGVFEPLDPVDLREEQQVQLHIDSTDGHGMQAWLTQIRAVHNSVKSRKGILPDSAPDIAADRMR